ncbi:tetratricopeptide repeat protein, partial [Crocosphaera chwakensis]
GRRVNQEIEEAKLLCKELGYLPLGLELVARFLKRRPNWSISRYRERLKQNHLETKGLKEASEEMTAQEGVKAAFDISWEQLNKEAKEIALYLSLFEVAPIEYHLIKEISHRENEDDLEEILEDSLINSNLVKNLGNQRYEIHTLIHQYLREKLEASELAEIAKEAYCQLIVTISQQVSDTPIQSEIKELTSIIPHLIVGAKELNQWINDDDLIWVYLGLGRFYEGQGLYKQAEPWSKQCLDIVKQRLGEEHPNVATSLNNLAELYNAQGRYEEAEPLYKKAIMIAIKTLGVNHPNTQTIINNYNQMTNKKKDL